MKLAIKILYQVVFVFGVSYSFFLLIGLFVDIHGINTRTPHSEALDVIVSTTSSPAFEQRGSAVIKHGLMSTYIIDCESGYLEFKIHGGRTFDYGRLLELQFYTEVMHAYTLREVCAEGGVQPTF